MNCCNRFNLLCLPFAGGSKFSYRAFQEKADPYFTVIPIDYPGRGKRGGEKAIDNVEGIVCDAFKQVKDSIVNHQYAVYGHSMGGLIAWLLCKKISEANMHLPKHLFVTGTSGPSSETRKENKWHLLGRSQFIQKIRDLKGCPDEILDNEGMMDYIEPVLRTDFRAIETFVYKPGPPLHVPITVITGTNEPIKMEDVHLWRKESLFPVSFSRLEEDHFFIYHQTAALVEIIRNRINAFVH